MEPVDEKPRKQKEKYAKLAAKSAKEAADESSAVQAVHTRCAKKVIPCSFLLISQ